MFNLLAADSMSVIKNPDLSLGAKGLWLYAANLQQQGIKVTATRALEENRMGRGALNTLIRELEEKGFLERTPSYDDWGMRTGHNWKLSTGNN